MALAEVALIAGIWLKICLDMSRDEKVNSFGGIMDRGASRRNKLIDDFHSVIADTEELMKSVSSDGEGKAGALREKIDQNLKLAREYLQDFEGTVVDKSKVAARITDEYVHENAWRTIGIAVGIGLIIGLLIRDRD
jgi:ElaB/YqjD/DUF883 family membrane-anchored ribosome-binding protein